MQTLRRWSKMLRHPRKLIKGREKPLISRTRPIKLSTTPKSNFRSTVQRFLKTSRIKSMVISPH